MDEFFAPLFASGRIVDAILVLVVVEALVLLGARARWGRGPAPGALLSNLASGAALMLALRAALIGTAWPGIAVWLAAALAAHLAEMVIRFRRDGAVASPDCDKLARKNQKWRTFGVRPPMT